MVLRGFKMVGAMLVLTKMTDMTGGLILPYLKKLLPLTPDKI